MGGGECELSLVISTVLSRPLKSLYGKSISTARLCNLQRLNMCLLKVLMVLIKEVWGGTTEKQLYVRLEPRSPTLFRAWVQNWMHHGIATAIAGDFLNRKQNRKVFSQWEANLAILHRKTHRNRNRSVTAKKSPPWTWISLWAPLAII